MGNDISYKDPRIHIMREVGSLVTSVLDMDQLMSLIIEVATKVMDAKGSSLLLVNEDGKKLQFFSATGEKKGKLKKMELNIDEGIAGWVATHGKPVLVSNVKDDKRWNKNFAQQLEFEPRSIACYPMKIDDHVIGVIEVIDKKDGSVLREEDMDMLSAFTELAASAIEKTIRYKKISRENIYLKKELESRNKFVGESKVIKDILKDIEKVANSKVTVLIIGESGTGKELVAKMVHNLSNRRQSPFITVSCGALPESLLERELFGHEKGSFTGADSRAIGLFEAANNGTLFLDEIGETTPLMQVKLLRVLQEGSFFRVGGIVPINVDVRIIAATNKNLEEMVKGGSFREDLFYRLNVIRINLPPLRERKEDIPILVNYFLKKHTITTGISRKLTISQDFITTLLNYDWPGNIRELENTIEQVIVMVEGTELSSKDLPPNILGFNNISFSHLEENIDHYDFIGQTLKDAQDKFKKIFLQKTLSHTKGNKTKAAKILGIQRTYLSRLLKEFNLN